MDDLVHALSIGLIVVLPAIGVGIGQGIVNRAAIKGINRQPSAEAALRRLALISMTLSETAVLLGVVIAILMLRDSPLLLYSRFAYLGIVSALALPAFIVGLVSAGTGKAALEAATRQPLLAAKITQLLLLTQTVLQTPTIFGFIIALLLRNQAGTITSLSDSLRLLASGLAFGLASIGPLLGLGSFTKKVCSIVGVNPDIYPQLRTFTFVSQALIEAPIVFALIVSLILAILSPSGTILMDSVAFLVAAFIMGMSTLGAGLNSGRTATQAASQIGAHPELFGVLSKMSLVSQTFIDTVSIYGLLLSLIILFRR